MLDVLSDGTESCENWRKTPAQGCTDANECGKGECSAVEVGGAVLLRRAAVSCCCVGGREVHGRCRVWAHVWQTLDLNVR